jgi:hypothetical protein
MGGRSNSDPQGSLSRPEDRLKHLEFIQATIARQAENSSRLKNWALTLAGASFALAIQQRNFGISAVATLILIGFAWLDAYYLRQERLFRELYNDAIRPGSQVPALSLDTSPYLGQPRCSWRRVFQSQPLRVLHGLILSAGLALTVFLAALAAVD